MEVDFYSRVIELYKKYGIKSVTMDDVSRELGISKKTLYQHVKDKRELIEKTVEFEYEKMIGHFREIEQMNLNAIAELFEVNKLLKMHLKYHSSSLEYDLKKYYPDIYKKIHSKQLQEMYQSVLRNINKGKDEGLYRKELNAEMIAKLYVGRMVNSQDNEFFSVNEFISQEAFREFFIYHIRGLANKKGISYLEKNIEKLDHTE